MNTKNTWGLVAAAAALFAFIYFVERGADAGKHLPSEHKLLTGLQSALVNRIEVQAGTNTLAVERTNGLWRVVTPVVYPALQPRIKAFLDECDKLTWTSTIHATELAESPKGLADYGLQPPRAQITLLQNGHKLELKIGDETPVGGQRYVQLDDDVQAFVVDGKIVNMLPPAAAFWRSPNLLPDPLPVFNRIELHASGRVMELQKDETNQLWRIVRPIPARADNTRIKDLIQQWKVWPVRQFVSDDPQVNRDNFGLKTPDLELILGQGTNDVFSLQFGTSPTNTTDFVYALRSSHTNIVLAPTQWLDPLKSSFTEFRDRRLLAFPVGAADTVMVRGEESFTLQRQTNGTWSILGQTNFVVDNGLANELLVNLNSLDVVDYVKDIVTDWTPYGLAQPQYSYVALAGGTNPPPAGTNTVVAELDLGATSAGRVFARRPDENSVYALSEIDALKLPRAVYQLRDRRIWNFTTNEVKQIHIEQNGVVRDLTRNTNNSWVLAQGSQGVINPFAIEETLYRLGELRATKWVARGVNQLSRYGINTSSHAITLTLQHSNGTSEKLLLRLGNLTPAHNAYAAILLDGSPVVFELPQVVNDYISTYLNAPSPPGAK